MNDQSIFSGYGFSKVMNGKDVKQDHDEYDDLEDAKGDGSQAMMMGVTGRM